MFKYTVKNIAGGPECSFATGFLEHSYSIACLTNKLFYSDVPYYQRPTNKETKIKRFCHINISSNRKHKYTENVRCIKPVPSCLKIWLMWNRTWKSKVGIHMLLTIGSEEGKHLRNSSWRMFDSLVENNWLIQNCYSWNFG